MTTPPTKPRRLRSTSHSLVKGLAVSERRVPDPQAALICVHGALDRGGSFARLARQLEAFDVITYDRRGYQGSRERGPLGLHYHVDDLVALVDHEAERGPVILVGHSFGGVVALGAALREFVAVRLVIAYESPFPWILRLEGAATPPCDDARAEAERFFRRVVSDEAWTRLSEPQRESRRRDGPALLNDLTTLQRDAAPYDLSRLRVSTSYVYGGAGETDYFQRLGAKMEATSRYVSTFELKNATHAAHLKNPEALATLVRERWDDVCTSV